MYFRPSITFTHHAQQRMSERRIAEHKVKAIIENGDCRYRDGNRIFSIGDDNDAVKRPTGGWLLELRGIHVVCERDALVVITVYREDGVR